MIALLDNTVLSNFATVRRPDLLRAAFGDQLATARQAFDELQAGVRQGSLPDLDWSWLPVWSLDEAELPRYHDFLRTLNAGEAACLTDARDAREMAHRLRIPLSGTLGILVRLVDLGVLPLDEADGLLAQMIAANYRSPVTSLRELL
jgi:predicted nucleic acid-binding protein